MAQTPPAARGCSAFGRLARLRSLAVLILAAALVAACGGSIESRLDEARKLQESRQFGPSLEPLRSVLAEEPGHPEASFRLGVALSQTGQMSAAVFPLRQAAESDAFAVDAGMLLAQVLLATGNAAQAQDAATRVLERSPDHVEALALRVQTNHASGSYEAALADVERVVALEPGAIRGLGLRVAVLEALHRYDDERADLAALEKLHRDGGDLGEAARACAVRAASFELSDGNPKRGAPAIEACLAEYPTQPLVLEAATRLFIAQRNFPRVIESWRKAAEEAPESPELRLGYAAQLFLAGKSDDALAQTRSVAEDFGTAQAWLALADIEGRLGHADASDEALTRAADASPQDADAITLRRADLRVDSGDLEGAEKLAGEVKDASLAEILRGRILLEQGEYERALTVLEKALERSPNHPGARTFAGRAAERLGQTERALAHYREVVRVDPGATNAGLLAAALASSLGRDAEAVEYAARYLGALKQPPDAYALSLGIRAAHAAGMGDVTARLLQAMSQRPDLAAEFAVEKAWIARQSGGAKAAARVLAESGVDLTDPANEVALRAWVDAELALGRHQEALARVEAALRKTPARASLLDAKGRVLLAAGLTDAAREAFERAAGADPSYGPAKAGLAALALHSGETDTALRLFDEATNAPIRDPEAGYRAAQIDLMLGRKDEAERRLREALADQPDHVGANNDLAWLLAEQRTDLDRALALAERAVRLGPTPSTWDTLAFVQVQRGDGAAAQKTLETALGEQPGQPTLLYRLGLVRKASGDRESAANAFRQALAAGAFPEAEATRAELASLQRSQP